MTLEHSRPRSEAQAGGPKRSAPRIPRKSGGAQRRIVILGCTGTSTGELTIAVDWARRLSGPTEIHLVVSDSLPTFGPGLQVHTYPQDARLLAIPRIRQHLRALRPDVLVIADLVLFQLSSPEFGPLWTRGSRLLDPVVEAVREYGGRIVAVDVYDWDANAPRIDLLGRAVGSSATLPAADIGRLLPSPYLAPARSSPGRGRYAMMEAIPSLPDRSAARAALNMPDGPLVLVASSPWQHASAGLRGMQRVTTALPPLLFGLLDLAAAKIGCPITVAQVGPAPLDPRSETPHLRHAHFPQLPPGRFGQLLGAADLFFTANAIATTAIRAASMGVPVACLGLGAAVDAPPSGPSRTPAEALLARFLQSVCPTYPWAVWPLGLAAIVDALWTDNPLAAAQVRLDLRAPDKAVKMLADLISNRDGAAASLADAQRAYFGTLASSLDTPDVALEAALA